MNPLEFLQSLLAQGPAAEGPGRFAQPDLLPPPERESLFQPGGDNSPSMLLRRLLTGSSEAPGLLTQPPSAAGAMPDPEGAALAKSMRRLPGPSGPPPGFAVGGMPQPSGPVNPAAARGTTFPGEMGGQQLPTAARPMPAPAPMPGPRAAPMPAPAGVGGAPQPPAAAGSGNAGLADLLTGLQKNPTAVLLRDLFTGAMAGAATAQGPRAGNIGAFGTGYTAAQKAADARVQTELARQQKAFDQTLALRKDSREERGAGRSDEELGLKRKDQSLRERDQTRKEEESRVKNQVAVDKLMRVRDGQLPVDAKFKLTDQLLRYADKINKNGLMQPAELDAALRKEQNRLEGYYGVNPAAKVPQSAVPDGATATGPNGEKMIRRGGQWVPLQ